MKKVFKYLLILGILPFAITSCNNVLQMEEQTAIDGDRVFRDPELAELFLNNLYGSAMPGWSATANVGRTDESVGRDDLINGVQLSPTANSGDYTLGNYSYDVYAKIRNINFFMDQIENGSIDQDIRDSFIGQALFLRAWLYWGLVLDYGGVPLVTTVLDNNDNIDDQLPRASATACVNQIVTDLDNSISLLGTYGSADYGRITKSAAAAFKGRVLLFYASPQFLSSGISNADGDASRWDAAYQANVDAKQIAESEGHGLYPDFSRIFVDEDNLEAILIRKYSTGLLTHSYENSVRPSSVDNSGNPASTPSWDLAKSFPMKSGVAIDEAGSGYDEQVYWANRDPRFAATIGYNSIAWKFKDRDDLRQWTYMRNEQEGNIIPNNGFYVKKHINPEITNTQTPFTPTDWIEIRYAEVLLNLAECANEVGKSSEAYSELYAIRDRAGIDKGTGNYGLKTGLSKTELRAVIMNERKIEMAYENKRYHDLRRRNLYANGIDGTPGAGLSGKIREKIVTTLNTDYIMTTYAIGTADSAFMYFESDLINTVDWDNAANYKNFFTTSVEDGESAIINYLQPEYNFFFLPVNALAKNENLEQTKYWLDENGEPGTFDPLAE